MNPHSGLTVLAARALALACVLAIFALPASAGWKEKVLYSFQGGSNDGQAPSSGVVFDRAGNLYGVTGYGGVVGCTGGTCGGVYQLRPPVQKGDACRIAMATCMAQQRKGARVIAESAAG